METDSSQIIKVKMIFLGDTKVGKTSILTLMKGNAFESKIQVLFYESS